MIFLTWDTFSSEDLVESLSSSSVSLFEFMPILSYLLSIDENKSFKMASDDWNSVMISWNTFECIFENKYDNQIHKHKVYDNRQDRSLFCRTFSSISILNSVSFNFPIEFRRYNMWLWFNTGMGTALGNSNINKTI